MTIVGRYPVLVRAIGPVGLEFRARLPLDSSVHSRRRRVNTFVEGIFASNFWALKLGREIPENQDFQQSNGVQEPCKFPVWNARDRKSLLVLNNCYYA